MKIKEVIQMINIFCKYNKYKTIYTNYTYKYNETINRQL